MAYSEKCLFLSIDSLHEFQCISEKYGVFSKRIIKPRTQFGPLEAPVLLGGADLPPEVFDIRVRSLS